MTKRPDRSVDSTVRASAISPRHGKRTIFAITILILLLVGGVAIWSRAGKAPSVSFVGYRASPAGTVAVFRATNASSRPFAYWGLTASEPLYWYRIASGKAWQNRERVGWIGGRSNQTLPAHSSIEFTVLPPATQKTSPCNLRGLDNSPPPPTAAFAIVMAFKSGDGPSAQADSAADRHSLDYYARGALMMALRKAYLAGALQRGTYYPLAISLMPNEGIWVTSEPAPR